MRLCASLVVQFQTVAIGFITTCIYMFRKSLQAASPEVLITCPSAYFLVGCDQKLRYDLKWPNITGLHHCSSDIQYNRPSIKPCTCHYSHSILEWSSLWIWFSFSVNNCSILCKIKKSYTVKFNSFHQLV